jgi:hypothetical protein
MPSHNASIDRENRGFLWGIHEIAAFANVSRARAARIVQLPWFPEYYDHMAMGTTWVASLAEKALEEHGYPKPESERPLRNVPRHREPKQAATR